MESISNENELNEISNESAEIEQNTEVEKAAECETELNEELLTEEVKPDVDIIKNNDTEDNATPEPNLNQSNSDINIVDREDSELKNEDNTLVEEETKETENLEESIDIEADGIDGTDVKEDNDIEGVVPKDTSKGLDNEIESSQDVIVDLINDIIEVVYRKCEGIIDEEEKVDSERNEHPSIDRIEEVNEPEEQVEETEVHEEDEVETLEIQPEETKNSEYDEEAHEEDEEYEDNEIIDEEPKLSREELILELKKAEAEKNALCEMNTNFQHKLGEYLRRKKADQPAIVNNEAKDSVDFDQKYDKLTETLRELMEKYEFDSETYKENIEELKSLTFLNSNRVMEENGKFKNYRFSIAQKSVNTRTGKSISGKEIEELNETEEKKEAIVSVTRLESIKLQNEVNKSDSILKSKEELADGLHLIDFEQFKIENQSYNEKLEERTEDLLKLRKKITSNVHVLTHVKEKLEFVKIECDVEAKALEIIDEKLNKSRDNLTSLKQSRDKLRISNDKMKRSSGMLGNRDLLRNYEDSVDTVDGQKRKMNDMKNRQLQLSLRNQALQMKIENTRKASSAQ